MLKSAFPDLIDCKKYDKTRIKYLKKYYDLPWDVNLTNPFRLSTSVKMLNSRLPNGLIELVTEEQQLEMLHRWYQRALQGDPGILCIGETPSDAMGKLLALKIVIDFVEAKMRPKWERISGDITERPDYDRKANLLVISNIPDNCSGVKLEKTRDLLATYINLPRIVVLAGGDPYLFSTTKLHERARGLVYLSPAQKIVQL